MNLRIRVAALLLAILFMVVQTALASSRLVVLPAEDATSILVNPLMGFQDDNVNRDWLLWSTGYLRASTVCEKDGNEATCGPLNWDRLNPEKGVYVFDDIDRYLTSMAARQKFAGFRIRNVGERGTEPTIPQWAKDAGVTTSLGHEPFDDPNDDAYLEIDYHTCAFLDLWGNLVQELVKHYDNHPQVSFVDIGSYGYYGEWFSGKTVLERFPDDQLKDKTDPTLRQSIDTRTRIIRMFTGGAGQGHCVDSTGKDKVVAYQYQGFKTKPVLISRGDPEDVALGVANGAGIRFDAVGAADNKQLSFRKAVGALVSKTWKSKPILGEFGTPDYAPLDEGFTMRALCFAREFHVSALHNNFEEKPVIDLDPLFRELGYRIVLTQASYPTGAAAGDMIKVDLQWVNKGTAPVYQHYPLILYFKPAGNEAVAAQVTLTDVDIAKILPAEVTSKSDDFLTCPKAAPTPYTVTATVTIPKLAAGTYDLYFAFQEPVYQSPIQLALTQKDAAGRYLLGSITIQ
ncbi:MAG: DUF4832 domain-containing protein [Anaerolineae bacterium]|nr:DUF4832 domain-containing protein [Anaerolineae bacterium]